MAERVVQRFRDGRAVIQFFAFNEFLYAAAIDSRRDSSFAREIASLHAALILVFPVASVIKLLSLWSVATVLLAQSFHRKMTFTEVLAGSTSLLLVWLLFDRRRDTVVRRYALAVKELQRYNWTAACHIFLFLTYAFIYVRSPEFCIGAFIVVSLVGRFVIRNLRGGE